MKRFIIICLCINILFGCSAQKKEFNDVTEWNEIALYNRAHNDTFQSTLSFGTENGVVAYPLVEGEEKWYYYPVYFDGNKVYSMNTNIGSMCSYNNPDGCDNLIERKADKLYYYKGKLYFIESQFELSGNYVNASIYSCNLDGPSRKKLYEIESEIEYEKEYVSPYIQFHKNKLYLNYCNKLYIADLNEEEIKKVDVTGIENFWKLFLVGDSMIVTTEEYDDGKKLYFNATIECDLVGNIKSLLYDDMYVMLIDDKNVFYKLPNENGKYELYVLNRINGIHKKVDTLDYLYILSYENTYLIDTSDMDANTHKFSILDENGDIKYTKNYTEEGYFNTVPLYLKDRYYVCKTKDGQSGWFAYYEINENGISDIIVMDELDEF